MLINNQRLAKQLCSPDKYFPFEKDRVEMVSEIIENGGKILREAA